MRIAFCTLFLLLGFLPSAAAPIVKYMNPGGTPKWGAIYNPVVPLDVIEGDKLSGTRIEAELSLLYEDPGDIPTWWSRNLVVTWNGEVVYERPETVGECEPFKIRYASTKFADGTSLVFRVQGEVSPNPAGPWHSVDLTFTFTAYNKLQLLGTNVDEYGVTNPGMQLMSDVVTNAAKSALASSHTPNPGGLNARSETKSSIISKSKPSTVINFVSHGSNIFIADSNHASGVDYVAEYETEIQPEVAGKVSARIPQYNLCAVYSCSSLAAPTKAPAAYGIAGVNQAYLGFPISVAAAMWSPDLWVGINEDDGDFPKAQRNVHLGQHAQLFWDYIGLGKVAQVAVEKANMDYPPCHIEFDDDDEIVVAFKVPMQLVGDPESRIHYVYLTPAQRAARAAANLSNNVWWVQL